MSELAHVLQAALSLGPQERATLAERLLSSLDELSQEEVDALWAEEAVRRQEEYRQGRARAVDAAEVHQKARNLLK